MLGKGPRYRLTVGVINLCERANAMAYDVLWGMTRAEGAWLYDPWGE
jgi:hypothetical protein